MAKSHRTRQFHLISGISSFFTLLWCPRTFFFLLIFWVFWLSMVFCDSNLEINFASWDISQTAIQQYSKFLQGLAICELNWIESNFRVDWWDVWHSMIFLCCLSNSNSNLMSQMRINSFSNIEWAVRVNWFRLSCANQSDADKKASFDGEEIWDRDSLKRRLHHSQDLWQSGYPKIYSFWHQTSTVSWQCPMSSGENHY